MTGTLAEYQAHIAARGTDADRGEAPDGVRIRGTVFAVIPGYRQVKLRTGDGDQYSITRRTAGDAFDELSEGREVELMVSTGTFPRVLSVRVVV